MSREFGDLVAIFCAGAYGASASPAAFLGQGPARKILVYPPRPITDFVPGNAPVGVSNARPSRLAIPAIACLFASAIVNLEGSRANSGLRGAAIFEFFLIYAVVFALLCGYLAQNKGYSFGSYAVLGFLLGIFALLYVGFLRDNQATEPSPPAKRCPDCAEVILAEASKCRFCGADVADIDPSYFLPVAGPGKKFCHNCNKQVKANARGCVYCNARL